MAFTLKKHNDFEFALEEDPEKIYVIPHTSKLNFDEAAQMAKFADENTITKQGELVKKFVLHLVPELKEKNLGDMQFYEILNAYMEFSRNDNLGESSAS